MWTAETRALYERKTERYPSDLTDEEWELVEPTFHRNARSAVGRF